MVENFVKSISVSQQEMLKKWVEKLNLSEDKRIEQQFEAKNIDSPIVFEVKKELRPLSQESQDELKEKGYPDSVIESIGSEEEKEIYQDANLEAKKVNGRDALVKKDIDINQKDDFGRTNLERMEKGLAPLDKDGNPIELHHIGQKMDSPLAELTRDEHRGKGNDTILHNKQKESEINREDFAGERAEHWKARAEQIKSEANNKE